MPVTIPYLQGEAAFRKKLIDWVNDDVRAAIVASSYVPNYATDDFWNDVQANEIAAGDGYAAGGASVAGRTVTVDTTTYDVVLGASSPSWTTASGLTGRYVVWYQNTGTASTSRLIACTDFGANTVVSGVTVGTGGVVKQSVLPGGTMPESILIAGTDAPQHVKDAAEYLCDGIADEVQWNAALALTDRRPIKAVGTFVTAAAIAYVDGVGHDIVGSNEYGTQIKGNHTGNVIAIHSASIPQNWYQTIENVYVTKGASATPARGISIQNGAYLHFKRVRIESCDIPLYSYFGNSNTYEECSFYTATTIGTQLTGASGQGSHLNLFSGCDWKGTSPVHIQLTTRARGNRFEGCNINPGSGKIGVQGLTGGVELTGNVFQSCWFEDVGVPFDLQAGSKWKIKDCIFAINVSQDAVKVSGFGATASVIVDPDADGEGSFANLPAGIALKYTKDLT